MEIDYRDVSGSGPRPFIDVLIEAAPQRVTALVDSGATGGLFHTAIAEMSGIDLTGADHRDVLLGPGGHSAQAAFVTVSMEAAGHVWEPEIGFCESVPLAFGLLGQAAFFRWFTVTFRGYDQVFEVEPIAM